MIPPGEPPAGSLRHSRTNNATIELIIEQANANNSLAGYLNCPNARKDRSGTDALQIWVGNYLQNG